MELQQEKMWLNLSFDIENHALTNWLFLNFLQFPFPSPHKAKASVTGYVIYEEYFLIKMIFITLPWAENPATYKLYLALNRTLVVLVEDNCDLSLCANIFVSNVLRYS